MSIGLIGTKIGMTREFMESGQSIPVTVIRVEKGRVLDVISKDKRGYSAVKIGFFKLDWFSVYDFIEYIVENIFLITSESLAQENLQRSFNNVLERELSAYRFINGTLSPITNAQEIEMINTVLNESKTEKLLGANEHLKAAQSKLSDRENPDYRNSIKESISAVESIVKLISEDSKATLGQALKLIGDKVNLHSALKEGFEKLYGWTCDGDGIRHALMEKSDLDFDDAKYMLVSCSAFVHYLIMKAQKSGIKL